jgi:hypothetical protein
LVFECTEQTAKSITATEDRRRGGGNGEQRGASRPEGGAEERTAAAKENENSFECILLLHARASLVFFGCELASPWHRERGPFRRTRVKIEFFIPSGPSARQFHHYN